MGVLMSADRDAIVQVVTDELSKQFVATPAFVRLILEVAPRIADGILALPGGDTQAEETKWEYQHRYPGSLFFGVEYDDRVWVNNTEVDALRLARNHGYEIRRRRVGPWEPVCSCPPSQIVGSGGDVIDQDDAPDCPVHGDAPKPAPNPPGADAPDQHALRDLLHDISSAVDDAMGGRPIPDVLGEIGAAADKALAVFDRADPEGTNHVEPS